MSQTSAVCNVTIAAVLAIAALLPVKSAQASPTYIKVSTGYDHACALVNGGTVQCWGGNEFGQLGNNSTSDSALPVTVHGINDAVDVSAGGEFACAARANGSVWCWGFGSGRLGNGAAANSLIPVQVTGISTATAVATGSSHACARMTVISVGRVMCWGNNGGGQIGNGDNQTQYTPVLVNLTGVSSVATGGEHTCVRVSDSTLRCWGRNNHGQLGNNSTTDSNLPVTVDLISTATAVAVGGAHSCARLGDSTLRCWGNNVHGEIGDGSNVDRDQPSVVAGINTATSVSAGAFMSCAALADGTARCWGADGNGALGAGPSSPSSTNVPLPVVNLSNTVQISVGNSFGCARLSVGSLRCWGSNGFGQVGSGVLSTSSPLRIVSGGCNMDIDGDDAVNATTDGVLFARAALGLSGAAIIKSAIGTTAARPDWASIRVFLTDVCGMSGLAP